MTISIYLAGPDVFLANAREIGAQKRALCERYGCKGLFPEDEDDPDDADAARIFIDNCALMREATLGMFNLTPFRGPSADVGTVFELGFMFALGKPVYGYSGAAAPYPVRVEATDGPLSGPPGRRWDRHGLRVEDFGLSDNLMIERAILDAGGSITQAAEDGAEPLAALKAFEACLRLVAQAHLPQGLGRSDVPTTA